MREDVLLEVRVREAVPLLDMVEDEDSVAVSEPVGDSEAVGVREPVVECEGVVVDDVLLVGRAVRVRVTEDERVGVGVPASSASMATPWYVSAATSAAPHADATRSCTPTCTSWFGIRAVTLSAKRTHGAEGAARDACMAAKKA